MGILNATPDSFYNKGRDSRVSDMLRNAEAMLQQGATILDVGGASTRPGQPLIEPSEELRRVIPAITAIRERFPDVWLSVDTYNAATARAAVQAGADIVNDISAGAFDADMLATVAAIHVPYIAMHIQGTPATMQQDPRYNDVVAEVHSYLRYKVDECMAAGIADVIVDPGFGFGKTVEHNFALLRELGTLRELNKPILAGLSRKSMICKPLRVNPEHALNGTTALNMVALLNGADILRVHDVKEAMEVIRLYGHLK
ncbi:dihydropteroate synthase [Nemorincola caseinilytica]|uniref:dihydropteroate synthase n=2 Tax=Nemorincola caseinilytica TaxID=2054315 RepID=A0ABP8NKK3_9BACT